MNVGEELQNVGESHVLSLMLHYYFFSAQTRRGAASPIEKASPLQWRGASSLPRGGASGLLKPIGLINIGPKLLGHVGQLFWAEPFSYWVQTIIFFLKELESGSLAIRAYLSFIITELLPRGSGQTMCPQFAPLLFKN